MIMLKQKRFYLYWILIGIFISVSLAAWMVTPFGNANRFFDVGYRESYVLDMKRIGQEGGVYSLEDETFRVTAGAELSTGMMGMLFERDDAYSIHYIYANLPSVEGESGVPLCITYRKGDTDEIFSEERIYLSQGEGYYELSNDDWDSVYVYFPLDESYTFQMTDIGVSEYPFYINQNLLWRCVGGFFVLYVVVTGVLLFIYCKKVKKSSEGGRRSVMSVGGILWKKIPYIKTKAVSASVMRSGLFIALYIIWRSAESYATLLSVLWLFVFVLFIPREKRQYRGRMEEMEVLILALLAVQGVMDLLFERAYGYSEVWMGLFLLVLGYFWMNMKRPKELLLDFLRAMCVLLAADLAYAWAEYFNYPISNYFRIDGLWGNPNPFSISLATMVGFAACYIYIEKGKFFQKLPIAALVILGAYTTYVSECRTALLMVAAFLMMLVVDVVYRRFVMNSKYKKQIIFGGILLALICFGLLFLLVLRGFGGRTVSGVDLSNGRKEIWTAYVKDMNLWGHFAFLHRKGSDFYSHNLILRETYKYGVIAGCIYVILLLEFFYQLVKKLWEGYDKALLAVVIGFFAYGSGAFLESGAEIPMTWTNWYGFYMMMLYFMVMKNRSWQEE